ncbi:AGAP006831-PA-like protein [Anopheles sinensis]|uniref:AGAP006831-PA-like protein n=1 Tax=Anopheles sinensis TaxID=74873 RepID=A0A084W6F6_ANOSI|nr:AGAP006831-PA-like protein [Anopheles sinensis]
MPAHFQQSVLQQLIPMLVVLSIVAALPSIVVRSGARESTSLNDIDQRSPLAAEGSAQEEPSGYGPEYEFAYGVQDPVTGDHKDQWERRNGDVVKGVYMLEEADGTQRIVEYEADGERGFRAVVTNVKLRKGSPQSVDGQLNMAAHSYNMLRATSS